MRNIIEIPGYCTLCRSRCGTLNEVRDDMLVAVRPDSSHPTGAAMCTKGRAAPEIVHSPHRQLYPMRRTTPKNAPDPGWQRITWEEALRETAQRLDAVRAESGPEAVLFAVTTPSGTPISDSIDWIERFVRTFGSPNICNGTEICNWHKDHAHAFTFGCGMPAADYASADTIVLWGHNPANTWLAQANMIGRARARGGKLLVVDPRPTALAREADVWLPVRPGTDAALALGMVRLMIEDGLYDEAFVRNWTNAPLLVREDNGRFLRANEVWPKAPPERLVVFNERSGSLEPYDPNSASEPVAAQAWALRGRVEVRLDAAATGVTCRPAFAWLEEQAAAYDPCTVKALTGVQPDALHAAAMLLSGGRRVAYHSWTGIGQHTNATQSERAVATLYALTGSFDRIGGNRVRRGPFVRAINGVGRLSPEQRMKAIGIDKHPIGPQLMQWVNAPDAYRAVLEGEPYRIRAMMAFGTNFLVSQPDTELAHQALSKLEFHVHCDLFETPSSRYADIFLPVNSPWEREGLRIGFEITDDAASLVQFRQRMVSPRGESRSDNEIVFDLAARLGMGDEFFDGSLEAGWNHMLEPTGLTVDGLRKNPRGVRCPIDVREKKYAALHHDNPEIVRGFDTETRRVEIYSERLLRHGQPAIATYVPTSEERRQARTGDSQHFPLVLSSAKNGYYCHSQHRSLVSLRKRAPDPVAEISPALAASRGLRDGDWMRISTRTGHARFVTRITPQLGDDVVVAEFGWWQACPELDRPSLPVSGAANSNFNSMIQSEAADPVSGSTPLRSFRCDIMPDPLTEERQSRWSGYRPFRIEAVRQEAEAVLGLDFTAVDGGELPDFRPGQHIGIRVGIGEDLVERSYSLVGPASLPGRRRYSIAIRRQMGSAQDGAPVEGRVSGYAHRVLKVGDIVELKAPSGSFVIPRASPQPLVLLAGGIGITPFINLLETLADGDPLEVLLYYANRNSTTHAFRERIIHHAERLPNLKVLNHYTQPLASDRPGVDYQSEQRITAAAVDEALIARRARFYICGPQAMMDDVAEGLVARGVPAFDIFREVFRSPPGPLEDDGRSFKVTFSGSGKGPVAWTAANGPLLHFSEKLGLTLPNGCRVGQCESCAVRVISGEVRHLHGENPDDPSMCLTCQAIPLTDLVLDA